MNTIDIKIENLKPMEFFPYPHIVTNRIINIKDNTIYRYYQKELASIFSTKHKKEINYFIDNKTVFKCLLNNKTEIYIGFYDWDIQIGFDVKKV